MHQNILLTRCWVSSWAVCILKVKIPFFSQAWWVKINSVEISFPGLCGLIVSMPIEFPGIITFFFFVGLLAPLALWMSVW